MHTVLGIDPGLAATGYGLVSASGNRVSHVAHGVIRTAAAEEYGQRLLAIRDRLHAIVAEHRPDEAAIEHLYFSRNVKTAIPVAQARGVIILVLAELGVQDEPLLKLAMALEKLALEDEYFVDRKLFPNVDFYSGIILRAMGIPMDLFTVMFAVARTVGWVAQWNEMIEDPGQKIGRPRQLYVGAPQRPWVPIEQR